jgi:hypothetical protein
MAACSSTGVTTLKLISILITPSSTANSVLGTTGPILTVQVQTLPMKWHG